MLPWYFQSKPATRPSLYRKTHEIQLSKMWLKLLINFWNGKNSQFKISFPTQRFSDPIVALFPLALFFCCSRCFQFLIPCLIFCGFSTVVLKFEHLHSMPGYCQVESRGLLEMAVFVTLLVVMSRMFNMSTFIYLCLRGPTFSPLFVLGLDESCFSEKWSRAETILSPVITPQFGPKLLSIGCSEMYSM